MYQSLSENQKKYFFNSLLAVFVFLALFVAIKAISAIKEYKYIGKGVYSSNVITVSGKGEVVSIPDVGYFSFSVVETGNTVALAQEKATTKINKAIETLKASGVKENDIKTDSYNSYPKYEYNRECPIVYSNASSGDIAPYTSCSSNQVLKGYEVSQSISVKVRDTAKAGDLLTKIGSLSVSNISGLSFVVDDLEKVQAEAREKAIENAKQKAEELSKSLGINLKKIISYYEVGNGGVYYGGMEGKGMSYDTAVSAPQIPVGENKIISNINISYEVEQ